jgi:hypothetical protein
MNTHELADALKVLAAMLKRGQNVEVGELDMHLAKREGSASRLSKQSSKRDDLPVALSALLSLSRIDKREWISLITELGLEVPIGPRDSSRDVVGKVLRHLETVPEARAALMKRVHSKEAKASPELVRALSSLLNN